MFGVNFQRCEASEGGISLKLSPLAPIKEGVVYTLCQIRFAPVLKMRACIPDIQEQLRANYDEFEEEQLTGFKIRPIEGDPVELKNELRWRLERTDRRAGFVLHNASLVYHTTDYEDFDKFVDEILKGFKVVSEIAKIPRVQRIGLRYVDIIEAGVNCPIDDYLHPSLRGFGAEIESHRLADQHGFQYIFNGATSIGKLVIRVVRGKHDFPVPPDLMPLALVPCRIPDSKQTSVMLDTDHFVENTGISVDLKSLEELLRELKLPISEAFKLAITDKAVASWK